jgi:hypothetical protein
MDGSYVMCGDNQFDLERGIRDEDIIGVLVMFYRNGKRYDVHSLKYKAYVEFWYYTRLPRMMYRRISCKIKRMFNIEGKSKKNEKKTDGN